MVEPDSIEVKSDEFIEAKIEGKQFNYLSIRNNLFDIM